MIAAVIPAKNEESNIIEVIKNINNSGLNSSDIYVIDNNSDDLTMQKASEKNVNIVLFSGKGYEQTVSFGLNYIKKRGYKKFLIVDGDNEIDFNSINKVLLNIDNYDFICGRRDKIKRFSEKLVNYFFQKRNNIFDLMCGLKAGNIDLLNPNSSLKYGLDMFLLDYKNKKKIIQTQDQENLTNMHFLEVIIYF